jgi:hypoxanthine phosphoribosyltransferase
VLLVAVLKGSVVFLADLARRLSVPVEVDFLAITSYAPGTGRARVVKDLDVHLGGRDVVLVEDVVDTGLTLTWLLDELGRRAPASLEVCTLVDKVTRRIVPVPLQYVGYEVTEEFLLGYGLDFAGRYRNLDFVAAGDLHALRDDPDAYVGDLYPRGARGD